MNIAHSRPKILAPVGSFESLAAAIQAGADAVYFGVEQLNMRSKASDPLTQEDIPEIAARCKEAHLAAYLTLNSTVYDHDKRLYRDIIATAKANGINAVIASDMAVIAECRRQGMSVHLSTQSNVTNLDAVKFFASFADLIVLSRELTLTQIGEIVRGIKDDDVRGPGGRPVMVEVFAHGALCMAVSGKCYLSLHSNNSSANRGACIQNCRHRFKVHDEDNGQELVIDNEYIMSAKDLCTIEIMDQLMATGIGVLKIEGRGRSADYVYSTVQCYREAVTAVAEGSYTADKVAVWKDKLASVYNRGFWEGYYLGRKFGEWAEVGGSKSTRKKTYVAKGIRYYPNIKVAEFRLESGTLKVGDDILLIGPLTGVVYHKVEELRVDNMPAESVGKGKAFAIPFKKRIRPSDKLYKLTTTEYAQDYVLPQ